MFKHDIRIGAKTFEFLIFLNGGQFPSFEAKNKFKEIRIDDFLLDVLTALNIDIADLHTWMDNASNGSTTFVNFLTLSNYAFNECGHPPITYFKDESGKTLLHLAAAKNFGEAARLLVLHGADPEALNNKNQTPSAVAISYGNKEIPDIIDQALEEKNQHPVLTNKLG